MAVFTEPQKWAQTLGKDADVTTIPNTAGETDPSIDKIFPSVFSIPLAQGGRAIPRSVLNGLFKLLGDCIFYMQNGGLWSYNSAFDYAVGRIVLYNNNLYKCIQANGASTTVKAPTDTAYWSKITTLADVSSSFANKDLSNITDTGKIAIAHNAMPSEVYDDLTLGASGTMYTAPADGFFSLVKIADANNQAVTFVDYASGIQTGYWQPFASGAVRTWYPVKKGKKIEIDYTATGTVLYFRFIYAVGSESEQA